MRLIKKLTGCIEVIAATAVVATTLFGGLNVPAPTCRVNSSRSIPFS